MLHTAVTRPGRGIGIGIVQRAECAKTGRSRSNLIPDQERKYGFTREQFEVENIKSVDRAQMLALLHSLGLAHGTIKRAKPEVVQLRMVKVYSNSSCVVESINHHIERAPDSLQDVVSDEDRSMVRRVLASIRRLSRFCGEVIIAIPNTQSKEAAKAMLLGRRKHRKVRKSRHRSRMACNTPVREHEEAGKGKRTFELVIRVKEGLKDLKKDN